MLEPDLPPPDRRVDLLARVERAVIVVLFAALTVLGAIQVINRYVFRLPVWNIEQLLPHIFIVITFIGLGLAFRTRAHLAVTLLPDSLPRGLRRWYELVIWTVSIAFLAGLGYSAWGVMLFQFRVGALTNMGYPAGFLTATVLLGCALGILRILQVEIVPRLQRGWTP